MSLSFLKKIGTTSAILLSWILFVGGSSFVVLSLAPVSNAANPGDLVANNNYQYHTSYEVREWFNVSPISPAIEDAGGNCWYGGTVYTSKANCNPIISIGPAEWNINMYASSDDTNPVYKETWQLTGAIFASNATSIHDAVSNYIKWNSNGQTQHEYDPNNYANSVTLNSLNFNDYPSPDGTFQGHYTYGMTTSPNFIPRNNDGGTRFFAAVGSYGFMRLESSGIFGNSVNSDIDEATSIMPSRWDVYSMSQ